MVMLLHLCHHLGLADKSACQVTMNTLLVTDVSLITPDLGGRMAWAACMCCLLLLVLGAWVGGCCWVVPCMLNARCLLFTVHARFLLPPLEPRYGKEILGKRVKIQSSDGKRWRNATVSGYHGGYLRHTGK